MNFVWRGGYVYMRCVVSPGALPVGYVKISPYSYEAHIYSTVSPAHPRRFDDLASAKAYVEEEALIGLTVNRLGV